LHIDVAKTIEKVGKMRRRNLIIGGAAAVAAIGVGAYLKLKPKPVELGFVPNPEFVAKARALIAANPMVDTHAHPGKTFIRDNENTSLPLVLRLVAGNRTSEDKSVVDMNAAGMSAVAFAGVADFNVIGFKKGGGLVTAREFKQGEAIASYRRQIDNLRDAMHANNVEIALTPADVRAATAQHKVKAILTMEGADFLEGKLERLKEIYDDGVRSVTIVHYRASEVGDIQTQAPVRGGLTGFGVEAVKEMQRLGLIIDLAHASEPTAFKALENVSVPVMLSHTHLNGGPAGDFPRFVTNELAQAVVKAGGIIGAWPTGVGITTLGGFVDRILELANRVGIDGIAIGTDMDANYKPVLTKYIDLVLVVSELLRRGMSEIDVAKFMGGNFLRVFDKVVAAAAK